MSEITVRALQATVEFDAGAVFSVARSSRVDQLVADGRLEVVDAPVIDDGDPATPDDIISGEKHGGAEEQSDALVGSWTESDVAQEPAQWDVTVGNDEKADTAEVDGDTPPAATESEPEPRKASRARKPKEDAE